MDQSLIVKNGSGDVIARGTLPDLDEDHGNMSPEEAAKLAFTLESGGASVTLDELIRTHKAKSIEYDKVINGGSPERVVKKGADLQRFVGVIKDQRRAYDAFKAESRHAVTITFPAASAIDPLTRLGADKAKDHPLYPLKQFAGQTRIVNIPIPAGYDFHKWTPEISERVMKAIDEDDSIPEDVKKAMGLAAGNATLGPQIKVHFGFVDTDLGRVYGEAQVRKAEATEDETDDRHAKVDGYLREKGWHGPSVAESLKKADEAMRMVRKLLVLMLELIDFLIMRIASGDTDALAMSNDIEAAINKLMASEVGLISAKQKRQINERLTKLAKAKIEASRKAREAYRRDQTGYAKHQEEADVAENEINMITPLKGMLDNLVETFLEAARMAAKQAESIRFKADQANNTRFG